MNKDRYLAEDRQHKPKILIIEDCTDQAVVLGRWVKSAFDANIYLAESGAHAKIWLEKMEFDLIITDVDLPDTDGVTLLSQARALQPRTPTMVITAHQGVEVAIAALRSKADEFVQKPLAEEHVIARCFDLLRLRKIRRRNRKTILAIGAHPDDIEIGCGGKLLAHIGQGDRVVMLVITDGAVGGESATRRREAQSVAASIGAEIRFASLRDTRLADEPRLISNIERVIKDIAPDTVYTHSVHDTHQDHRAVHEATRVAARNVDNLLCYQSPSSTIEFSPTLFSDIGQHMSGKLELLKMHGSQSNSRPYLSRTQIEASADYWGRFAGYKQVEAFEVLRSTQSATSDDTEEHATPTAARFAVAASAA